MVLAASSGCTPPAGDPVPSTAPTGGQVAWTLNPDDRRVVDDAFTIPAVVEAGQEFDVRYPTSTDRGIHYSLMEVAGDRWVARYVLTSAYSDSPPGDRPTWAVSDPDLAGISLGKTGRGPDTLIAPPTAEEGHYVLCMESGRN